MVVYVLIVGDIKLVVHFVIYQLRICFCGVKFVPTVATNNAYALGFNITTNVLLDVVISVNLKLESELKLI